jgi:hypothetical protein
MKYIFLAILILLITASSSSYIYFSVAEPDIDRAETEVDNVWAAVKLFHEKNSRYPKTKSEVKELNDLRFRDATVDYSYHPETPVLEASVFTRRSLTNKLTFGFFGDNSDVSIIKVGHDS